MLRLSQKSRSTNSSAPRLVGAAILVFLGLVTPGHLYAANPSITSLTPNSGAVGASVTIAGSNFGSPQGSSTVKFNGTLASAASSWSTSSIAVVVPSGATTGNVVVTVSGRASNGLSFTVLPTPSITSLSLTTGAVGASVTLFGNNFGTTQGTVKFNGTLAFITSWSATSVSVSVPPGATTGNVVVHASGVDSNGVSFTVVPAPSISSLSPNSGAVGTSVTISGSNFGASQGTVNFNGAPANITTWAANSIAVSVPSGATTGNVVVHASGVDSNGVIFTVPAPTITSISPISGRYGTSVTIAGSNFGATQAAGSSTVKFGSTSGSPTSWSNTSIVVPVPNGAAGGTISVTVTVGVQPVSTNFTVIPPPNITSLSPTSGPVNTSVTVSGSGFGSPQGASTVTINTTAAVPFSWGDSSIIVRVPAGATTGSVVVTAGGQASNNATFTVTGGPSITTINPSSGAAGTGVTITGSNFGAAQGSSVVKFNGVAAKVTSWGVGSIGATAPAGVSTGPVKVTVSGQDSNGVTFTAITAGTLSGTVSNTSNVGIAGATVQALQNGVSKASTTSGGSGTYAISNLAAGTYDIQASASTYGTALQNSVLVPANQTTTQNFTLSTPGSVGGKVTQSDGVTAISGAIVQAYVGSAVTSSASSDSGGNYSILGLNAATYRVQASSSGYVSKSQSVSVTGGSNATANFSLQTPGSAGIQYVYDELGRLAGVIDPAGDAATYQYDAVGNILSISRQGSSQVSIISFTPKTGTSGASVTINGTGFSGTPSQNTVQFNGTSATVTSATATQISTTVPSGATTGPITVTCPNGSATSGTNFTIGSTSGLPTITGFTPNMGLAGTAVSITGTNFDVAANDKVTLNISHAPTISAIPNTQISTSVPSSTTSGHVSVLTPVGQATSTQDFFIPFGSHSTSDIAYTGRVSVGGAQTVTLGTASKIGLLLFDGVAGQGVTLQLSGSTFSSCTLYLYSPTGAQLAYSDCSSSTTLVTSTALPLTGTYTIGIDPGPSAGAVTITLVPDSSGTISIDGPPVTITTTTAGQDARLSFSAAAGQRIVVYATNVTSPAAQLYVLKPDGTRQTFGLYIYNTGQTYFIDRQTLAIAGTYELWVQHNGTYVGSETLQIASVPADLASSVSIGGSASTFTTVAGQNANITFSNPQSQSVSIHWTSGTYPSTPGCFMTITGPAPSNTQVGFTYCYGSTGTFSLGTIGPGSYNILVDPQAQAIGGISLTVNTP